MKHLILSLSLFLFTIQTFSKDASTGNQLVRLVCHKETKKYTDMGIPITDRVLIMEQTSSKALNTDTALSETIDGSVLIDPDNEIPFTDDAAFRVRVYNTSLVSAEKTEGEIIETLLSSQAGFDSENRLMDYTGIGFRSGDYLTFQSEAPYDFLKEVNISMRDFKGDMDTNLGASTSREDGLYSCKTPVLIPETVGESSN